MKHKEKYCPRCKNKFECNAVDILNCQCSKLNLSEDTLMFLQSTAYRDCLCNNCLTEISEMVAFSKQNVFPNRNELMMEGVHYYFENGYLVFTELYHVQRGYCCKNNCRHCAYGSRD